MTRSTTRTKRLFDPGMQDEMIHLASRIPDFSARLTGCYLGIATKGIASNESDLPAFEHWWRRLDEHVKTMERQVQAVLLLGLFLERWQLGKDLFFLRGAIERRKTLDADAQYLLEMIERRTGLSVGALEEDDFTAGVVWEVLMYPPEDDEQEEDTEGDEAYYMDVIGLCHKARIMQIVRLKEGGGSSESALPGMEEVLDEGKPSPEQLDAEQEAEQFVLEVLKYFKLLVDQDPAAILELLPEDAAEEASKKLSYYREQLACTLQAAEAARCAALEVVPDAPLHGMDLLIEDEPEGCEQSEET